MGTDGQLCPNGIECWTRMMFVEGHCSVPEGGGGGGERKSHMKKLRMLVVSIRDINQGFWSDLGRS